VDVDALRYLPVVHVYSFDEQGRIIRQPTEWLYYTQGRGDERLYAYFLFYRTGQNFPVEHRVDCEPVYVYTRNGEIERIVYLNEIHVPDFIVVLEKTQIPDYEEYIMRHRGVDYLVELSHQPLYVGVDGGQRASAVEFNGTHPVFVVDTTYHSFNHLPALRPPWVPRHVYEPGDLPVYEMGLNDTHVFFANYSYNRSEVTHNPTGDLPWEKPYLNYKGHVKASLWDKIRIGIGRIIRTLLFWK
jgi:hypothetical protein